MHISPGIAVPEPLSQFQPFSKESNQLPELSAPVPAPIDAHQVLTDVLGRLRRQIDAKRLDLNLQFIARGYQVRGDRDRMEQIYQNLLSNAFARAPRGSRVTVKSTCPTPEALRVEVTHSAKR